MWRILLSFTLVLPAAAQSSLVIGNAANPGLAGFYSVAPGSLAVAVPNGAAFRLPDKDSIHLDMRPGSGTQSLPMTVVDADSSMVWAIVPSNAPIGSTTVTMTVGQAAISGSVYVSRSSFALFSRGTFGNGPAVAQNVDGSGAASLNQLASPAVPGQFVTLWGSGLGDFTAADVAIQIYDTIVQPAYAGRAPNQPGLDQINFRLPATAPAGCYIAVTVRVGGVDVSNQVTLAIAAAQGNACIHPLGLSPAQLLTLDQGGTVTTGSFATSMSAYSDGGNNPYSRYESANLQFLAATSDLAFTGPLTPPALSPACSIASAQFTFAITGVIIPGNSRRLPSFGDAGPSISLSGPDQRMLTIPKSGDSYSKAIDPVPAPTFAALAPPFFSGGSWTLDAPGGRDFPAFQQTFTLSPSLRWTNRDTLSVIDRNADLVITWDGNGYAPTETVTVVLSTSPPANTPPPAGSSAAVFCRAAAQAGKLIITRDLLQPIAPTLAGFSSSLYMSVLSDSSRPNLFQVPLKFGGTAPVSVSRASNETISVVIQ